MTSRPPLAPLPRSALQLRSDTSARQRERCGAITSTRIAIHSGEQIERALAYRPCTRASRNSSLVTRVRGRRICQPSAKAFLKGQLSAHRKLPASETASSGFSATGYPLDPLPRLAEEAAFVRGSNKRDKRISHIPAHPENTLHMLTRI